MAEAEQAAMQLVDGAGVYNRDGFASFCHDVALPERGLSYAVVAIMGPQSSGKSTLLNNLFGTRFRMMDFLKGRGQTTQGIWLAAAQVPLETFTLLLDLEGTDGRERGEDDTAFEKQSSLFALATADVIMVNMWCHDIGREHAANKPLLKTVFQVMMRLFLPRKATLLFVIRDKTRTPIESLEPILREDLDKIWSVVPKPEQHKDSVISDFFNVEVTWLPNFEEKEEEFMERVGLLRERFQRSIEAGGIAGDRTQVVPASALPLSFEEIWKRIRLNKDLDLPAHKVMVATVRCEQIAEEKLRLLLKSEDWARLKEAVASGTEDLPTFGAVAGGLALKCLGSYDEEAVFFEEGVRESKREHLLKEMKEAVVPVHEAALAHVSRTSLAAFKEALEEATGGTDASPANFAASSQKCQDRFLSSFAGAMQGLEVAALGLGTAAARERFESALRTYTEDLRSKKLQELQENARDFLVSGLVPLVASVLEAGKPQAWEHIRRAWGEELGACLEELEAALKGFALTPEEARSIRGGVEAAARKAVEDKTKELAKRALPLMKERFTAVFMHDAQGMPQRWTGSVDVPRKASDARLAALHVLAAVTAVQLEARSPAPSAGADGKDGAQAPGSLQPGAPPAQAPAQPPAAPSDPVLSRLLPLLEPDTEAVGRSASRAPADSAGAGAPSGSHRQAPDAQSQAQGPSPAERRSIFATKGEGKGSLIRLWENIPASDTFLTPEECRSLWKQFTQETMFQLAQALQAQEASSGTSWLPPPWTIGMMLLLGFNEIMAILRNPLLVLLLVAVYLFGRAVWAQLEGEDIFQHGMIPGLLALSSRLGPAVVSALHTIMDRMVRLLEALGEQQRAPSQYAHGGGHALHPPPPVDASAEDKSTAESSSTGVQSGPLGGQQLRHRPGVSTKGE